MVELTLPKNSRIRTGKTWPKPEGATNVRKFSIYRWNPDDGENPRVDTYFDRLLMAGEPRETRLVVIGQAGLDRAAITAALAA